MAVAAKLFSCTRLWDARNPLSCSSASWARFIKSASSSFSGPLATANLLFIVRMAGKSFELAASMAAVADCINSALGGSPTPAEIGWQTSAARATSPSMVAKRARASEICCLTAARCFKWPSMSAKPFNRSLALVSDTRNIPRSFVAFARMNPLANALLAANFFVIKANVSFNFTAALSCKAEASSMALCLAASASSPPDSSASRASSHARAILSTTISADVASLVASSTVSFQRALSSGEALASASAMFAGVSATGPAFKSLDAAAGCAPASWHATLNVFRTGPSVGIRQPFLGGSAVFVRTKAHDSTFPMASLKYQPSCSAPSLASQ
mmetsp:Transcript_50574/g.145816  ORF Transcript_50574/g.145816 Transcript_50574/m.145816 type:complete len:329 (+) Transcript_50574:1198-2184(+)